MRLVSGLIGAVVLGTFGGVTCAVTSGHVGLGVLVGGIIGFVLGLTVRT